MTQRRFLLEGVVEGVVEGGLQEILEKTEKNIRGQKKIIDGKKIRPQKFFKSELNARSFKTTPMLTNSRPLVKSRAFGSDLNFFGVGLFFLPSTHFFWPPSFFYFFQNFLKTPLNDPQRPPIQQKSTLGHCPHPITLKKRLGGSLRGVVEGGR